MNIHLKYTLLFTALLVLCAGPILPGRIVNAKSPDAEAAGELPDFHACIEYTHQGYIVKGTFTEFPTGISHIEPLYSLDGKTWKSCGNDWNLQWLGDKEALTKLQNQTCLYSNNEPLKSYLQGKSDRFFLKLRLTMEYGLSGETRTVTIDRGAPQSLPEDLNAVAKFAPSLFVCQRRPFTCYGKYQITVKEDSTPNEINALLPDTLPIEVQLQKGIDHVTEGIVNCPVKWKPLTLPRLTAGESVTIADAAEEIVIPAGTMLHTPLGIFRLDKSIRINQYGLTDEVRLVLNVVAEDDSPSGVLTAENTGLELAFKWKASGAAAIHAYTYSEGDTKWTELAGCPLLESVNAQPSTANSGYTPILSNGQEPYRSYLAAKNAGNTPTPFLIALKIEGGVYDGKELILAWPDTYELPPDLPEIGGSGGNECNAGSGRTDVSTEEGQRPSLPIAPEHTENPQNQTDGYKTDKPAGYTQPPRQAQEVIKTKAKSRKKTVSSGKNADTKTAAESATRTAISVEGNPPVETGESARPKSSNKETNIKEKNNTKNISGKETEKPVRQTGTDKHGTFPLIPVALTAGTGICIAGIQIKKRRGTP